MGTGWFIYVLCVGYVPKTIKKGEDEYMIVVQGVQDTGNICLLT